MGNHWSSTKEVKPLVVFDGEWRMALEPMQGNRGSSRLRGKSHDFSCVVAVPGVCSPVTTGIAFQNSCLFSDVRSPL